MPDMDRDDHKAPVKGDLPQASPVAAQTLQAGPQKMPTPEAFAETAHAPGSLKTPPQAAAPMAPSSTVAAPRVGSLLGRYVVEGELGAGGMGTVYRARDPELHRPVAIKLLRASRKSSAGSGGEVRLIREAQAMAQLSHPNILTVYEVTRHEGQVMIVMELVEGETLTNRLKQVIPLRDLLSLFLQAARGLAHAHKAGLIHRDFKPDNVLVDGEGRVRIMDFGLARYTSRGGNDVPGPTSSEALSPMDLSAPMTRTGAIMGTPAYMSPEQWRGGHVDARSDQFAFCVALYEALFQERPFAGDDMPSLITAVAGGVRRPLPKKHGVPRWLVALLDKGLSVEERARFASMDALVHGMERGMVNTRRRRVMGGVLVMVTVLLATLFFAVRSSKERSRAEEQLGRSQEALVKAASDTKKTRVELILTKAHQLQLAKHLEALRSRREALLGELVEAKSKEEREQLACQIAGLADVLGKPDAVVPGWVLQRTLSRCRPVIRQCYFKILTGRPDAEGMVKVQFLTDEDGKMKQVTILKDEIGSPELTNCMRDRMLKWSFPTGGSGKALKVGYSYYFKPDITE